MIKFKNLFEVSFADLPDKLGRIYKNREAIVDLVHNYEKIYTYEDISLYTKKFHHFLSNYLSYQEDIVYINKNTIEHIFLYFACLRGSFRYVPLNPRLRNNEIINMLSQLKKIKVLIYGDEFKGDVNSLKKELNISYIFHIDEVNGLIKKNVQDVAPYYDGSIEQDWIILFTSGTTGIPKAARLPNRMVMANIIQTVIFWNLQKNHSSVIHTPFFHAGGLNVFTTPLLFVGGKLYLLDFFNPEKVLNLINEKKITHLFAVPTMFQSMINSAMWNKTDFSSLNFVISGGAPCPEKIIDEFQKKGITLRQGFGMTEVGVNCFFIDENDVKRKKGSVGIPMPFLEVNITELNTKNIIEGEGEGVMWFKGLVLFNGYQNVSNEEIFDNFLGFCSGDIAYRDNEGFYWIRGRIKDMIIRGGENIYPSEIEKEVYENSKIDECSVFGIEDNYWGEIPVLALKFKNEVIEEHYEYEVDNIIKQLKEKLASYKIPHLVIILDSLPKNATGKISKKDLVNLYNNNKLLKVIKIK
jgi:fatty-acyl-CoA synthase